MDPPPCAVLPAMAIKGKSKLPSIREFKKGLNIYSISSMISHP
ncbi:hypothetical protein ECSTECO31_1124 [Escherichia coli STEC_O31]|uniref:Uncharacterized protein n=2 Tax=Escherichia coli TaxID=562 RepID=A0A836NDM8_ECOLX|nr:Hypothetical protein FORC43_3170 [Escherichia coli]EFZ71196.1 hypothetical protein ECOK1357_1199 [Escherichia coli OK1357]EGW74381.1 hypothetical protein ECSTECB2F1_0980 [Escherichia coli O91:H21 str. B2F1]EJK96624.1 hypothetical protein ECSTECO31_1124 [Escherichia coli STEC_O31]ENC36029.1 hypothetical protein ECP029970676_1096 [Escherichia coli P02997067.6]KDW46522.1 hypothetical protein AC97_1083 [Escherichia coli 2-177-06_S4_C2]KDX11275.1 hypothetical protein AD27_0935 [Escherichia coli